MTHIVSLLQLRNVSCVERISLFTGSRAVRLRCCAVI